MKKKSCIVFVCSILVTYLVLLGLSMSNWKAVTMPEVVDQQIVTVQEGELIRSGQRTNITLPDYFDVVGETRLQFTLDYAFSGRTVPSLILQANHTFMTILLDGEVIYHIEPQSYSYGNYFTHIPLPQKVSGGQLEICVTVPESGLTRISMPELVIANEAVFLRQQVLQDTPNFLLNILILFSGFILLILAVMARKRVNPGRMLMRGFTALNCGLYFMCETYSVVYLASGARIIYLTDMLSFAMVGPMLLAMFAWDLEDWRKKLLNAIAGLGMAVLLVQLAVSIFGGIELRCFLPLTHAAQVMGILAVVICISYGLIYKKGNKGLCIGGLIALGGAVDLILFLCEVGENNVFFLRIGFLIYLFEQMYQFIYLLMKHSAEEARESYYKELAMQDPLSHCYSRVAFELDRNAWSGESARTVFFMDLNNLKTTNDLYGHVIGDHLISAFGDILNHTFLSIGKCYRAGGDEFWVFCDGLPSGRAAELMSTMQQAAKEYNQNGDLPVKLSYAIGMCDTEETKGDLNQVMELADVRMYENKRVVKKMM